MAKSYARRRAAIKRMTDECSPLLLDGRLVCPHGQDLHPTLCPWCTGLGCAYCYGTGMVPGCKICRGLLRLLGEIRTTDEHMDKVGASYKAEVMEEEGWEDIDGK
jgi:hypothetical protein